MTETNVHDRTASIEGFLEAAAAKQPTPGGGSAAALVGALAASMGEMTVNYSIGKKGLETHADTLVAALAEFTRAREMLLGLMVEDQAAYEAMTAAKTLPKDSAEREGAIGAAVMVGIRVPQTVAATAVAVLDLTDKLVDIVNVHLLSDLAVCGDLAMATTRCAMYNIRVNLPEVKDEKQRWQLQTTSDQLLSRAIMLIQHLSPRIWQRVSRGQ
jgi:formiminotetrahydrofolate cyclodeaminase